MSELLRPQQHLARFTAKYPDVWKGIAEFRALKGSLRLEDWPDYCYMPAAGAHVQIAHGDERNMTPEKQLDVLPLAALSAWRLTKGVYRFDSTIFEAVWETPMTGELPVELLFHLPEWCVYIEVPPHFYSGAEVHGFWVFVEWSVKDRRPELCFVLDINERDGSLDVAAFSLPLVATNLTEVFRQKIGEAKRLAQFSIDGFSQWTATDAVEQIEQESDEVVKVLAPLLSLTLYLCSATVEVRDLAQKREYPANPTPRKGKRGPTLFAAEQTTVWETGYRLGAALRGALAKQKEEEMRAGGGSSGPKAPHVRRAHWHTFLAGPRSALQRERRLKWLPPIPVGIENYDELPATVHPVK